MERGPPAHGQDDGTAAAGGAGGAEGGPVGGGGGGPSTSSVYELNSEDSGTIRRRCHFKVQDVRLELPGGGSDAGPRRFELIVCR